MGSVSVVSAVAATRSQTIATVLATLDRKGIVVHLLGRTRSRITCHVLTTEVQRAAQALHEAFGLDDAEACLTDARTTLRTAIHV